jgi:UDP-perosamine 4-acetyltransferase
VLIVGAGSHGRVIAGALTAAGRSVLGFLDATHPPGTSIDGCPVLGDDDALSRYPADSVELAIGIGVLPKRQQMFDWFRMQGYRVVQVLHPSVVITGPVTIGEGSQLQAGVIVQPGASIGDNVLVNTRVSIDHECVLAHHAVVSPGAVLCGNVTIGESATIGPGATVVRGCSVGARSVIGAGAVVVADVPPDVMVYGVPARVRNA